VRAYNILYTKRSYLIYPCPSPNSYRPDIGLYRDNIPNEKGKRLRPRSYYVAR